ncbi:MAG: tetratricopeptide repeat protein [bacterium]|nr:tetratricopeptide repeat protein [bacterium]
MTRFSLRFSLIVFFLSLILIALPCDSSAQTGADTEAGAPTGTDEKIRRLLDRLEATPQSPERVDIIFKLSRAYRNIEPGKALDYAKQGIELGRAVNYPKGLANCLNRAGIIYKNQSQYHRALECYLESLKIREKMGHKKDIAQSCNNIGNIYKTLGHYSRALEYYLKSVALYREIGYKKGMSHSLNNIGIIYCNQGNYTRALEYHLKSLKLHEETGDRKRMSYSYNNIGLVYDSLGNHDRALEYYFKSLKIKKELGNKSRIAGAYINIGIIYQKQDNHQQALEYFSKSLQLYREAGDKKGLSRAYGNIGSIYQKQGQYSQALKYHFKGLKIKAEIGYKKGIVLSYHNIGIIYRGLTQFEKSLDYFRKALELSVEMNSRDVTKESYKELSKTYAAAGNYKKAFEYHTRYSDLKDTLFNKEKHNEIAKVQTRYEVEKKEKENQLLRQNNQIQQLALEKQELSLQKRKNLVTAFIFISLLMVILLAIIYNRFRLKQKANRIIRAEKEKAVNANQAKSEFLANMSHEIRTPMNTVLGFTQIVASETHNPRHRDYLKIVSESGNTLLRLINDILDLSRIEAGKMELEMETVDPRDILNQIKQIFSTKIAEKDLEFQVETDPGLPPALMLDSLRLRQVLLNLVGNAVKFTHAGFIKLAVGIHGADYDFSHGRTRTNTDKTNTDKDRLNIIFTVQDSGIGIPSNQQQRIFEAFQQQEGQQMETYGGTGLGLSICQRLVRMMGGKLSVQSQEGKGSTFFVHLKNVSMSSRFEEEENPLHPDVEGIRFQPSTILVADDNAYNRRLLIRYLHQSPIRFIEAQNGKQAVDLARQHLPDAVLMDVKMPVMGGIEAARQINAIEPLKRIPVVIVTASALKEQWDQIKDVSSDHFLNKPVSKSDLIIQLMYLLPYFTVETIPPIQPGQLTPPAQPPQPLPPETRARLPQLLDHLQSDGFTRRWESLCETLILEELEEFSTQLNQLDQTYRTGILARWSQRLFNHLGTFDMPKIRETMQSFPRMIREIEQLSGSIK